MYSYNKSYDSTRWENSCWCYPVGGRNTHLLAIAPTVSNSRINSCSAGIEPQPANVYVFNGAKGTFIVKNPELEAVLEKKVKTIVKYGIRS